MAEKMKYQELAHGVARTYRGLTIVFPFGLPPRLLFFGAETRIECPARYGDWETPAQQRAYVRRFHADRVVEAVE